MKNNLKIPLILILFITLLPKLNALSYYWVGNSGNWTDYATHWATTSGGTTFHTQAPTAADDVFFDANSFTTTGQSLSFSVGSSHCRSMTWSGSIPAGTIVSNGGRTADSLVIYGSLQLKNALDWQYAGNMAFKASTTGNTIKTAGRDLQAVVFNGTGSWDLSGGLHCLSVKLQSGSFYTQNYNLHCRSFNSNTTNARGFYPGTSTIHCRDWYTGNSGFTMDGDSALFRLQTFENYTASSLTYGEIRMALSADYPNGNPRTRFEGGNATIGKLVSNDPAFMYSVSFVINNATIKDEFSANGNGVTFGTVEFKNNVISDLSITADTLSLKRGYSATIDNGKIWQVNHFITNSVSCGAYTTIRSTGTSYISVPSGTVSCNYLVLENITATGGATFNATNSVVIGSATGWNILNSPTPQTLYWVGGTGEWNDKNHWAFSSGGSPGTCVPTMLDNVVFDSNSFLTPNDTIRFKVLEAYCNNMTWSIPSSYAPVVSEQLVNTVSFQMHVFGNLTFDNGLSWSSLGRILLRGSGSKTITMAGVYVRVLSLTSTLSAWTLQDSLSCEQFAVNHGAFYSAGNPITCSQQCYFAGAVDLDTSRLYVYALVNETPALQFDGDSAIIECKEIVTNGQDYNIIRLVNVIPTSVIIANCTIKDFAGYGDIIFDPYISANNMIASARFYAGAEIWSNQYFGTAEFNGETKLLGHNSFDTLIFNNPGYTVILGADSTQTVYGELLVNSSSSGIISIISSDLGAQALLSTFQDTVCIDYVTMQNINMSGTSVFYAGANSTDLGNNTSVSFSVCGSIPEPTGRVLYRVNGGGEWGDPFYWSLSSGGTPDEAPPTSIDDVIFDENSASGMYNVIVFNEQSAACRNLSFTGGLIFYIDDNSFGPSRNFTITGSLTLEPDMLWFYPWPVIFTGDDTGKTITSANVYIPRLYFDGTGSEWTMQDSITCDTLKLLNGSLKTGGNNINCITQGMGLCSFSDSANLGTSVVRAHSFINTTPDADFFADSSTIECTLFESNYGQHYNTVWMNYPGPTKFSGQGCTINEYVSFYSSNEFTSTSSNTFGKARFYGLAEVQGDQVFGTAEFNGPVTLLGNNTFDTLKFYNAGSFVELESGTAQTVNNDFLVNANSTDYIYIYGNSGSDADIVCYQDTVCIDYVTLYSINASGPAVFYAGANSNDNGNNTNISFTECGSAFVGSFHAFEPGSDEQTPLSEPVEPAEKPLFYPNPANENTILAFRLEGEGDAIIELYDVLGKCIYREEKSRLPAGAHTQVIETKGLKAGIYNCRIISNGKMQTTMLMKTE